MSRLRPPTSQDFGADASNALKAVAATRPREQNGDIAFAPQPDVIMLAAPKVKDASLEIL